MSGSLVALRHTSAFHLYLAEIQLCLCISRLRFVQQVRWLSHCQGAGKQQCGSGVKVSHFFVHFF